MTRWVLKVFITLSLIVCLAGVPTEAQTDECPERPKPPRVRPNVLRGQCNQRQVAGTCNVFCKDGFTMVTNDDPSEELTSGEITCTRNVERDVSEWRGFLEFKCIPEETRTTQVSAVETTERSTTTQRNCPSTPTDLPSLNIKDVVCENTRPGTSCVVECKDDFEAGDKTTMTITCQDNGAWERPETCSKMKCRKLSLDNANTSRCSDVAFGSACSITCKNGFKFSSGDWRKTARCDFNGQNRPIWSGHDTATCEKISCPEPDQRELDERNQRLLSCTSRDVNSYCRLRCKAGYEDTSRYPNTKKYIKCELNGDGSDQEANWIGYEERTCAAKSCSRPVLSNTNTADCVNKNLGSECTIQCKEGYRFGSGERDKILTCDLNGNDVAWSRATETCERISCETFPSKDIEDKHLETFSCTIKWRTIKFAKEECRLRCKRGYEDLDVTEKSINCQLSPDGLSATWQGYQSRSCSKKKCKRPNLEQTDTTECTDTPFGSACTIRCNEHFKFSSGRREKSIDCRLSVNIPVWESTEACQRISCDTSSFTSKPNLNIEDCTNVGTGSSCQVRCQRGYKFVDGQTAKRVSCNLRGFEGIWSPSPESLESCQEIKCPAIANNLPQATSPSTKRPEIKTPCKSGQMRFDSECTLECPEGYEFRDYRKEKTITCDVTGTWFPTIPSIGICKVKIHRSSNCEFWSSGETAVGVDAARQWCKDILGNNSVLAMTKTEQLRRMADRENIRYFVGAGVVNDSVSWEDEEEISGLGSGSGNCVVLVVLSRRTILLRENCASRQYFMCERPYSTNDPCRVNPCEHGGVCVPHGCSFKCKCRKDFFGLTCEKGPFNVTIKTTLLAKAVDIEYRVSSEAGKSTFELYINGEKEDEMINIFRTTKKGYFSAVRGAYDLYVSGKIFLSTKPDISQYECVKVSVPDAVNPLNITKNQCDGTVLHITWNGLGTERTAKMPYDIYIDKVLKDTSSTKSHNLIGLNPGTSYNITVVPHIEGCQDRINLFRWYKRKTSRGPPDPPTVVLPESLNTGSSQCNVTWKSVRPAVDKEFKVKITELVRSSFEIKQTLTFGATPQYIDVNETRYDHPVSPNSIYEIAVGTKPTDVCRNIVPISWTNVTYGCRTDSTPPDELRIPLTVIPNSGDGTVSMELEPVDERNGLFSCYIVIVQKMNVTDKSNSTNPPSTNIELLTIPNGTVEMGDSYVAVVLNRFEGRKKLILGDGQMTCCNMRSFNESCSEQNRRKRAADFVINGENLELESSSKYRHYVVVSTPTNGDNHAMITSRWSDPWSVGVDTGQSDNIALGIALPLIFIIIFAFVVAGIIIYRRKYAKSKAHPVMDQQAMRPMNRGPNQEDSIIDAGLEINTDDVIERNLAKYSFELANLYQVMEEKRADEDMLFLPEFKGEIKRTIAQCGLTCDISRLPANRPKNRYKNIVPYDNSRVYLEKLPGNQFSDYINAAYIDGYNFPQKFIATQGPLPGTVGDFWRMIWEQNCNCIAMLTNVMENNKVKCAQYWPEEEGKTQVHSEIGVTWKETSNYGDYVRRKIQISKDGETRSVFQFHFIAWPDHGIPNTTSSVIRYHKSVTNSQSQYAGPIVVHCSAGVGRTGTFIALDILSELITVTENINICATVAKMRVKRPEMVQTLDQYIFLHKLVLELYHFGETDADVSGFNAAYHNLTRVNGQRSEIAQEFAMLDYFLPLETGTDTAEKPANKHLNRDHSVLPYDHNAAFIQMTPTDKTVPYYNASIIDSYNPDYKFLVAQTPDEASIEMFWRAVIDNDASMVVSLCEKKEKSNYCYWPKLSEEAKHASMSVRTLEETTNMGLTERKFEVTNKNKRIIVTQIFYCNWAENTEPASSGIVLEIIAKVEKHHQSLSNSGKKITIVHCSDGSGRSGTFCAISNLIERLKNENRVDIFRTVKDLRDQRTMMVKSKGQYEFCYRSVSEFLKSFDLYGNFQ